MFVCVNELKLTFVCALLVSSRCVYVCEVATEGCSVLAVRDLLGVFEVSV